MHGKDMSREIAETNADLAAGRLVWNSNRTAVVQTATYNDTPERAARLAEIRASKANADLKRSLWVR